MAVLDWDTLPADFFPAAGNLARDLRVAAVVWTSAKSELPVVAGKLRACADATEALPLMAITNGDLLAGSGHLKGPPFLVLKKKRIEFEHGAPFF